MASSIMFTGRIGGLAEFSMGSEPASEKYAGCQIISCGFISGREKIARLLDCQTPATSENQLFALAYRKWGDGFHTKLDGQFCVAILDLDARKLLLARDAVGLRPLYYAADPVGISFSSHLAGLARGLTEEIDDHFVADYLVHGQHHGSRTCYRNVSAVPGGHVLVWIDGRLRIIRTWQPEQASPLGYGNSDEYRDHLRSLMADALAGVVERQTWAELSGGLDSSSIVFGAARLLDRRLPTISVIYSKSASADEREWMEEANSSLAGESHFLDGDKFPAFSEMPDRFVEQPALALNNWSLYGAYEKLLKDRNVDVLLSGFGGDQMFFGETKSPIYLADWVRSFRLKAAWTEIKRWQERRPLKRSYRFTFDDGVWHPLSKRIRGQSLTVEIPGGEVPWLEEGFAREHDIDASFVRTISPDSPSVWLQYLQERIAQVALVAGQFWNQFQDDFELRFPLLSRPLVEFMHRVPAQEQIAPEGDRVLQRAAFIGVLPEKIRLRRDKKGPDESTFAALRTNRACRDFFTNKPEIVERGYVDPAAWRMAVEQASVGHVRAVRSFLAATSLEIWLKQLR